jgi:cysteine desulfurase / selenocysteine lyase
MSYDIDAVRAQFPILTERDIVYLDSAASAQRPVAVLDAMDDYYRRHHANVHRGVHILSQEATQSFEAARTAVRGFLNARNDREVIFVRGTTEGINLVANSWGSANLKPGSEILLTELEHHSNIVPWQLIAARTGAVIRVARVHDDGSLDLDDFQAKLTERTAIAAFTHVSNALGTINPVQQLCRWVHEAGAVALVDGAQGAVHAPVDVQDLDCDFYVFSGHKVYGPTGIGALYGRESLLEAMPPWQGGGEMIAEVTFDGSTWAELPAKFEAGTPAIAESIGLGAAVAWMERTGRAAMQAWEHTLLVQGTELLEAIDGLTLVGTATRKAGVLSFVMEGIHPQDIGTLLDEQGIAVRTGHHCAQPLMRRFGVPATTRASLAAYTTPAELERLAKALARVQRIMGPR